MHRIDRASLLCDFFCWKLLDYILKTWFKPFKQTFEFYCFIFIVFYYWTTEDYEDLLKQLLNLFVFL